MPRALGLRWLSLLVGLAGCNGSSAFTCEDDVACEGVGPVAQCEANGYCSFEDADCEGGRRYGELAGDGLAGQCVGAETATGESGGPTTVGPTTVGPTTDPSTSGPSTLDGTDTLPSDDSTGGDPPQGDWWDCSWSARRELVIDVPSIGETLSNVPIMLVLDPSRIDPSIMAPDGHDLRLVTPDDEIVLAQDIERWSAAGLSFVWIRVPELHEGQNVLHMYYGNPAAPPLDPTAPWGDYAGVWHMGLELADASGHSELVQSVAETTPGQAADAQRFAVDGDGAEVMPTDLGGLFVSGGTITAMIRASGFGDDPLAMRAGSSNGDDGWVFGLDNNGALRFARGFTTNRMIWTSPDDSLAPHTWHHVAVVYQDADATSIPTLYIDGMPQRLGDMGNPMGNPAPDELIPTILLGGTLGADTFDGVIDEVRLAQLPRSGGWITVQNASLRDELVTYGAPQSCN